jgi:hypothetical protein
MDERTHRKRLEDLRDLLESALSVASPEMLPQLAGQYRATLIDLAKIDAAEPTGMIHDDLVAKRRERRQALKAAQ